MNSFLQSSAWADFQKSLGRKVWQVDSINIIKYNLPFGKSYLYSPHCEGKFLPRTFCKGIEESYLGKQEKVRGLSKSFLEKVKEIAKEENAIFWKVEPKKLLENFGLKKGQDIQPSKTLILDITKSEQELLKQMHSKTRYNIRLAEKKNIEIRKDKSRFEDFWRLTQKTTKRDKFRPHSKEYYKKMLEIPGVELFVAIFKEKIVAANIVVFYENTAPRLRSGQAIYLHGASDYQYRNLMAPHLLQWRQILEAKKRECTKYDFWGINQKKWPGVTRFKKGFNGQEVNYPGAYDLVFQPAWYRIYKIAKKVL